MAVNYRKIDLKRGDDDEDIADEGASMDTSSLTRKVMPRHTITGHIKTLTPKAKQFASPFARSDFHSMKKLFHEQNKQEESKQPRRSFLVEDDGEPVQVGSSFKAPKLRDVRLTKDYKKIVLRHSIDAYIVFLQRCWRAKKRRGFGCYH
jgi:hypothetical protein